MGVAEADKLQELMEKAASWPVWTADNVGGTNIGTFAQMGMYGESARDVALWVALRESDRKEVTRIINWPSDRQYRVDSLPERISQAFSDLLFGEDPDFTPSTDVDEEHLKCIVEENDLPSELRRWAMDCSSEGEIWWHVYRDLNISQYPIIEKNSRLDVVPYFMGRKVAAVAFVSDLYTQEMMMENQRHYVTWRHIEIHSENYVRNLLYRSSYSGLGEVVPLDDRPETQGLMEEWEHNLGIMLAGRIPNRLGRDWRLGVSDYQGIKDQLLDLNEARTIMAENARLTAKKRVVVPASAIDDEGRFDAGEDVIVEESLDEELGENKKGPYAVLEYKFDSSALIEHIDELVTTALTRVGLAEQFVNSGKGSEGHAYSGTALKTRLIPTTLAALGRGRYWDDGVPRMLQAMALVDNMPAERGGCGHTWAQPHGPHAMERSNVLPDDPAEEVNRHSQAVNAEIESVETAVRDLHPDWSDEQVEEELQRIRDDRERYMINVQGLGDKADRIEGETPNAEQLDLGGSGEGEPASQAGSGAANGRVPAPAEGAAA